MACVTGFAQTCKPTWLQSPRHLTAASQSRKRYRAWRRLDYSGFNQGRRCTGTYELSFSGRSFSCCTRRDREQSASGMWAARWNAGQCCALERCSASDFVITSTIVNNEIKSSFSFQRRHEPYNKRVCAPITGAYCLLSHYLQLKYQVASWWQILCHRRLFCNHALAFLFR